MSKNRVVHFEIGAEDPKELSEFYKKAFGWEINEWGDSGYFMVGKEEDRTEGAIFGGIMKRYENEKTINTIEVEDIDKAISDVEVAGGKIVKPKVSMPTWGRSDNALVLRRRSAGQHLWSEPDDQNRQVVLASRTTIPRLTRFKK